MTNTIDLCEVAEEKRGERERERRRERHKGERKRKQCDELAIWVKHPYGSVVVVVEKYRSGELCKRCLLEIGRAHV